MGLHTIRLYLEPNAGGVYTVTSPDVPGLVTEGSTPDEIQANVQEALDSLVEVANGLIVAIPDWGGKDLATGTVRAAIRELGISRHEFGPVR
jgi:antitoxin HicB